MSQLLKWFYDGTFKWEEVRWQNRPIQTESEKTTRYGTFAWMLMIWKPFRGWTLVGDTWFSLKVLTILTFLSRIGYLTTTSWGNLDKVQLMDTNNPAKNSCKLLKKICYTSKSNLQPITKKCIYLFPIFFCQITLSYLKLNHVWDAGIFVQYKTACLLLQKLGCNDTVSGYCQKKPLKLF